MRAKISVSKKAYIKTKKANHYPLQMPAEKNLQQKKVFMKDVLRVCEILRHQLALTVANLGMCNYPFGSKREPCFEVAALLTVKERFWRANINKRKALEKLDGQLESQKQLVNHVRPSSIKIICLFFWISLRKHMLGEDATMTAIILAL